MVHACVTMLIGCVGPLRQVKLVRIGHAHAAREHGTQCGYGALEWACAGVPWFTLA